MTYLAIYSDFDGTVTNRNGINTVSHPFYQSLLINSFGVDHYKTAAMKTSEEVQALFEAKFGAFNEQFDFSQEDADLLISKDALDFFHNLLLEERVKINIVTKNRADYIYALFKYQGFKDDELRRLNIFDSGDKRRDVFNNLQNLPIRPDQIYILDDSHEDFDHMKDAATRCGYSENELNGYNLPTNEFQWSVYQNEITELFRIEDKALKSGVFEFPDDAGPFRGIPEYFSSDPYALSDPYARIKRKLKLVLKLIPWSIVGFATGATMGIILGATGILLPFGPGILGIFGLSMLLGLAMAMIIPGFVCFCDLVQQKAICYCRDDESDSYSLLRELGNDSSRENNTLPEVKHYSSIITPPPNPHQKVPEAQPLYTEQSLTFI